jgi:protein involved in polysaccharide export with SLBB domain
MQSVLVLCAIYLLTALQSFGDKVGVFSDVSQLIQVSTNNIPATNTSSPAQSNVTGSVPSQSTNSPAVLTNSMAALDDKYRLAIGDRLSYRIIEDEEESKPLIVTDSGDVEFPYIGRFPVVGKTCKELAQALKAELEKEYYFEASVVLAVDFMTKSRGKVYLVGPVRAPGPQEIPSDEILTLSKAILRAGGFSEYADRKNVKVTRQAVGQDQTFIVNVADILEKGKTGDDLPLAPGDFVYIPERAVRF